MAKGSAEAAEARIRSTAARLAELRLRLERLERGDPSTQEDVERARRQTEAQVEAQAAAHQRLLFMHRSAAARHERHADQLASAGRTQPADRERDAARREHETVARLVAMAGTPSRPADGRNNGRLREAERPGPVDHSRRDDVMTRLRGGLIALLSWAGDTDLDGVERHRAWCSAIVDQCGAAGWRGWSHAVCLVGVSVLPGIRGAAVTVVNGSGSTELTAASDPWTAQVQELELIAGEGPTTTARASNQPVQVADLASEQLEWQTYASLAAERRVRGICAVPLHVREICVGTLTLYGWSATDLSPEELTDAKAFADLAAAGLIVDVEQVQVDGPVGGSPFAVHVAIGAISARLGITAAEAESRLRAYAFGAGLSVHEVAEQAIEGELDLA